MKKMLLSKSDLRPMKVTPATWAETSSFIVGDILVENQFHEGKEKLKEKDKRGRKMMCKLLKFHMCWAQLIRSKILKE